MLKRGFRNKGQISSETLVYVLTIVIVSVIVVMGYNYIGSGKKLVSSAEVFQLQNKISSDAQLAIKDVGSSKTITYDIPNSVQKVYLIKIPFL